MTYIVLIPLAVVIDILELIAGLISIAFIGIVLNILIWIFDLIFIFLFFILTRTSFKSAKSLIILTQGLIESIPIIDALPLRSIVTISMYLIEKQQKTH